MSTDNTKVLLIAQMKRAIEILESEELEHSSFPGELAELANKLLEIRRDSIRYVNWLRKGRWK